jgi:hypothetical protein
MVPESRAARTQKVRRGDRSGHGKIKEVIRGGRTWLGMLADLAGPEMAVFSELQTVPRVVPSDVGHLKRLGEAENAAIRQELGARSP